MSDQDDDDKQHEPSQKRLDDARKRGEIPKSTDLTTAASYGAFVLVALVSGASLLQGLGQVLLSYLDQSDTLADLTLSRGSAALATLAARLGAGVLPFFVLPAAGVLLTLLAQRAVYFAPDKLTLRWSRLSPIKGAKQKFGGEGLFEFGKSLAKLIVIALVLGAQLSGNAATIMASMALSPEQIIVTMLKLFVQFMLAVVLVITVFGVVDYLWQRSLHVKRNRMSRKDLAEEMKDSEGDPHLKQQRRQRGQEIATNRMLLDVGKADVVVVNPTHYAVALKWNRKARGAPVCVAKGVDELAARIREKASAAGVPIHSDPPTARMIHATVEVGEQIRPDQYRAVAAAIRFAESMRKRRKVYLK